MLQLKKKAESIPLDFEADAGKLKMHNESPWVYMWGKAENNILKMRKKSLKSSLAK